MPDSEKPNGSELILYRTQEGGGRIDVLYQVRDFLARSEEVLPSYSGSILGP